ncbi:pyocin knob domain-containing protein, partial [Aeromonas hydrophila]|uniref:pyocin knob domain-containing protein n=1 Tax=Aeromonas hydrophila TaxID=644 RepID=UPI001EE33788
LVRTPHHNHVIGNVDGLQEALTEKLDIRSYKARYHMLNNNGAAFTYIKNKDMNTCVAGDFGLFEKSTCANSPPTAGSYFYSETKLIYSTGALLQLAWPYDGIGVAAMRNYSQNTSTWGEWRKLYDTGHKPTLSELGAAALSHTHSWADVKGAPDTATRWPSWTEVTSKPDLALANHTHPGSLLNPINLSTEDLDTLNEPKVYAQHANANTSVARHYPENSAGALIVTSGAGVQQTYHVYNSSRVWRRAQYAGGSWTLWTLDYNTGNKPTLAELGAAAASHTHTAAQGNADIVAGGHSQIGSYMLAAVISSATIPGLGSTIAGANLRPSGCNEYSYSGAGVLAGTWKQLGHLGGANTDDRWDDRTTLFIRIA